MKISCPDCGRKFDLEEYLKDQNLLKAFKMLEDFAPHGRLIFEYCEKFRIGPPFNARKFLRLLGEIMEIWRPGRFAYQKKTYEISREGLAGAMRTACNQQFKSPLSNHNYLKKVAIGIAEEERVERGKAQEKELRAREKRTRQGDAETRGRGDAERLQNVPEKVRGLLEDIG
jgi:hypothetical protein